MPSLFGLVGSKPKSEPPQPFGGQKLCPVTGEPLGPQPIAVETSLGRFEKQSIWKKIFGQAQAKGPTIYVCCQQCAAKVRSEPAEYFVRVLEEKNRSGKLAPP
ncbi:MAG: hypothetical protein HY040_24360 [Planctomycetes bacterium]|nr:hypothetical protein [Planctomycetota bacterium]